MIKEEIIEAIEKMSVLDLSDLVHALEERFGVTASAPVAVVAGAAQTEALVPEEEQTEFDVILKEIGPNKIKVIKAVRELTGLGLRESKAAVDAAPNAIREAVSKEEAEAAKAKLEEEGAIAEIR